jgi:hypothetical protein
MDNVGIVVEDLATTIDFFREVGLELEGQGTVEGEWAGRCGSPHRAGERSGLSARHVCGE